MKAMRLFLVLAAVILTADASAQVSPDPPAAAPDKPAPAAKPKIRPVAKKPAPSRKRKMVINASTTTATIALPLKKYLMMSSGVSPRMRSRFRLSSALPTWRGGLEAASETEGMGLDRESRDTDRS